MNLSLASKVLRRLSGLAFFLLAVAVGVMIGMFWNEWGGKDWFLGVQPPVSGSLDQPVGSRGPFELRFEQKMQPESVEERIDISPAVAGKFTWEGLTMRFWPAAPLQPGTVYHVTLGEGSKSASGRTINQAAAWDFSVRLPAVIYVHPVKSPDFWIYEPEGKRVKQLTQTGGKVFDYGASTGGDQIAVSIINEEGGVDLWLFERKTGSLIKLLDCATDWCFSPAWSPDDSKIAYIRRPAGKGAGAQPGMPRVFILEYPSRVDRILYDSDRVSGNSPAWSPDGRYLAFLDILSGGIRIFDLETGKATVIQTQANLMGSWSPDGRRLALLDFQQAESGSPYSAVYLFAPQEQTLNKILPDDGEQYDFSVPSWSPEGNWLALAMQPAGGAPSKQIWLMHPDGSQAQAVTSEEGFTHAAYSFSPDGGWLVYQRISLAASQARPELMLWQRSNGEVYSVAGDAALPSWLP